MFKFLKRLFKPVYVYHVYFGYQNEKTSGEVGLSLRRKIPIKTIDDLDNVREYISESNGFKNIVIKNWIRLKPNLDDYKHFEV